MTLIATSSARNGSSLIETVIAMGVLAVAIPLVFGTLAESGKSTMSSVLETRSAWIVPVCMDEIRASRDGRPQFFTATTAGQAFPPVGDIWALVFSPEGKALGKITKSVYDSGTKDFNGQAVRYIATLSATAIVLTKAEIDAKPGAPAMMRAAISLEYPVGAPAAKRQKIGFYSRLP